LPVVGPRYQASFSLDSNWHLFKIFTSLGLFSYDI
jgi:hypothetical protein